MDRDEPGHLALCLCPCKASQLWSAKEYVDVKGQLGKSTQERGASKSDLNPNLDRKVVLLAHFDRHRLLLTRDDFTSSG